jgi:hypothetical protein
MRKFTSSLLILMLFVQQLLATNYCLEFTNSKNNGVRIPHTSSLDLTDKGTVEAWVYFNSYKQFAGIVHKGDRKDFSDETYTLQLWNNNKIYFALVKGSTNYAIQSTTSVTTGRWYHISASWDVNGMYLYINGVLEASTTNTLNLTYSNLSSSSKNGLNIGRQLNENYNSSYKKFTFDGKIDEVRIWKVALSQSQVRERMFAEITSSDSLWGSLVCNLQMNEGSGTVVNDNKSRGSGDFIPTNSSKPEWQSSGCPGSVSWSGSSSTNWASASNWDLGYTPNSWTPITIGVKTNMPAVSTHVECGSLTLESGASLVIKENASLTLHGALVNNGNITLQSSASGTASLLDDGNISNNGNIYVERYLTGGKYHYVSSSINNCSTSAFGDAIIYAYDETNTNIDRNYGWTPVSSSSGSLINAKGYAIFHANTSTDTFTGDLNTGNISIVATRTNSGSSALPSPDGWNIIGNPYPSAIDANSFLSTNTDLTGAIYFWSDDGSSGSAFTTADYATYTSAGGVGASGGGYASAPDGKIAVGQAFFIQVKSGISSTSLSFNNSMRQNNTTQYYIPNQEMQKFRIDLYDERGNQNEILLTFTNAASKNFDQNFDALKVQGNPNLSLYSLCDEYQLIIQGLPWITENVSVPVGYFAREGGTFTFERFEYENLGEDVKVYLEDKWTREVVDILNKPVYSFASDAGSFDDRFVLHFIISNVNGISEQPERNLDVYAYKSVIHIPQGFDGLVCIYSPDGKLLKQENIINHESKDINISPYKGVAIVVINNNQFSKKVFLSK